MGILSKTFPNAKSVDSALKRANKAEVDINALNKEVPLKVSEADFREKTQDLQNQINNIVRAPESGGDVAAEVSQARVGFDGTSYDTLKERLDTEMSQVNEDVNSAFNTMYDLKDVSLRKNIYISKADRIPESFIAADGSEHRSGTGTGNNWCTGFIRVPVGETIHVISPIARCSVAAYTKDRVFSSFVSGAWDAPLVAGEYTFISTVPYIRLSFYDPNGFTDEKYDNVAVFYRMSESSLVEKDNIVDLLGWSLCVLGNTQMNFSATTIAVDQLITSEKPLLLKRIDDAYNMAVTYIDPDDYSHKTDHIWFSNNVDEVIIPANVSFFLGLRKSGVTNQKLPEIVSEIISLTECDNTILYGVASAVVFNGAAFRNFSPTSHRVANPSMRYAEEDMLFALKNTNAVYTLIMCAENELDYFSENWTYVYSQNTPYIIPKGTWYGYSTCYKSDDGEYGTESMAQEMYDNVQVIPVSKLEYITNGLQSTQSQIATLLERINSLETANNINTIPTYYNQYLADKISAIEGHNATARFGFITDTHYNGYNNAKHSKALMTRICKEVPEIHHFFNGGDLINTAASYTKEEIIRSLNKASDYVRPDCLIRYHNIIGNHDTGEDYGGGVKIPAKLTVEEYANATGSYLSYADEMYDPLNCSQYYVDDGDVRYIVLNGNLREITGETYTDTWRFFARSLLSANNKTIVVFNHIIRGSNMQIAPFSQTIMDAIDAYNAREEFTYSGATFDFSNSNGQVACFIGGHTHKDESFTTTDGVPVIISTTDNAGAEVGTLVRTIGTTSEQAFDIFTIDTSERKIYATRIGAGSDRQFSY